MTDQDQVFGVHGVAPEVHGMVPEVHGVVPEQRSPTEDELFRESYGEPYGDSPAGVEAPVNQVPSRLRVDARRNLESVLRAARQVFGELGYDAPMEEVARRAGVGVGTVYRRFPSKEVLVQRIAAEEVAWLTTQARDSLYGNSGPWDALAEYLARAVASGAGRLLPPSAFRYAEELATAADGTVPEQRLAEQQVDSAYQSGQPGGGRLGTADPVGDADPRLLLHLLAALVARAAAAGELRSGVTVADVVLVLTAAVPVHVGQARAGDGDSAHGGSAPGGSAAVQPGPWGSGTTRFGAHRGGGGQPYDAPAERLLRILLQGLRAA
ncbi:TetR/AcrR family transcriptional regulator [Kitasatospora sp. McL0602]|uniref:TetR/AcrR family transcriptional regulator n=1 Tax=Kitasatospora sp. McL0602 TaxID=3439530 RepID=UPI003F88BFFA